MTRLLTISLACILAGTASFAQDPINSGTTPPTLPQPILVDCQGWGAQYDGTTWAFNDIGDNIAQIGTLTIGPGGVLTGVRTTNRLGTILERLASFYGQIAFSCFQGTTTVAGGTLQLGGGIGGQYLSWFFPTTATLVNGVVTYVVTSTSIMNLRPYGALDPARSAPSTNNSGGYSYGSNTYVGSGVARRITGQVPCPDPADLALETFAPNGYSMRASVLRPPMGTGLLRFTATPVNRRGGGSVNGNINPNQYATTGAYQVYSGCTGFSMNIPTYRAGVFIPSTYEGVFAAGDHSVIFILPTNTDGPGFTGTKVP